MEFYVHFSYQYYSSMYRQFNERKFIKDLFTPQCFNSLEIPIPPDLCALIFIISYSLLRLFLKFNFIRWEFVCLIVYIKFQKYFRIYLSRIYYLFSNLFS